MAVLSNAALATQTDVQVTVTPQPPATGVYTVKVVNRAGTVLATLERANVDSVDLVFNEIDTAEFHMHPLDPQALELAPDLLGGRREVQIWRDDRCIFWGVPLTAQCSLDRVSFGCRDIAHYYTRRFFGPVQNNYLDPNADFESGKTGWAFGQQHASSAWDISTAWRALGSQSARITGTPAESQAYIYRRYTTTTTTQPVFFAVKALCHIVGSTWLGPAFEERGLYIEQQSTPGGAPVGEPQWDPITESTPRDHHRPVRLETGITIPAGVTRTIEVRLYAPGATIYWDATALVTEESVGSQVTGDPANIIITRVNQYAQDAAWGKSDLAIGTAAAPGTYESLIRIYQFYDNGNVWEALSEYPKIGVCDIDVTWDPYNPTTRNLFLWPGKRGVYKAGSPITLGTNVVQTFSYDVDAAAVTTKPRVLGQDEGADNEVAEAIDTSQMDGLVLESVDSAPADAPLDTLYSLAAEKLADAKKPVRVPDVKVRAEGFIGVVELGDTVPVTANYGYVQEVATQRRIIRMRIDAAEDTVALGWN